MTLVPAAPVTGFGTVAAVPDLPSGFGERFRSSRYDLGDLSLHAVTGGSGPAVLLVGGWPQFWWQWRKVMLPLAEHFTVIAVDPRGVGRSDLPETGYDSTTAAGDLARLMTALGHDRFRLVGHDVGMMLAYALAADHPSRVTRLVLAEAALPGISDDPSAIPPTTNAAEATWHFMFNRLPSVNEELVEGREDLFYGGQFAAKGATPDAMPSDAVAVYVEALRRPGALHASFQYYRALDVTIAQNQARLRTPLTMPVLAVGGAAFRGAAVARDVRRVARDVRELVIEGCGHYVPEEAPEVFTSALLSFFAPTASARA
ncbi:alpha/beta hydrolase [Streptomyces albus]|uniref:Alpha/beta hydrolase n=1 Tax=Streptomyces albus (strain ATCC 21838 / DSM 41398 / FERM P-419 / JCM 4703 / NBRC 107858) TaxID=1081613 RepID=A0A0B5EJ27_STRA4|nr:alpha/beta hydrolase [Streptomyces albus]AOU75809.1 alpha/beta hydrolase [Streptomyces albus]